MAETPTPQIKWIRRDDSTEIYTNFHFVNWSIVDVRLRFGQLTPTDQNEQGKIGVVAEEQAAVTMSWASAKVLRDSLSDAIQRYEKANGIIEISSLKLPE